MKTCKEMAKMWNVTERTVTTFCKSGKIPGAVKKGKSWQIPDNAERPADGRISSGNILRNQNQKKKNRFLLVFLIMCVRSRSITMLIKHC